MTHSLIDTKDRLVEQMLLFLWRQWSAVGVAATSKGDDHWVIDPEALLLISSEFARHDARLFDEILDWLHLNGNLINLKRLFSIKKQLPLGNAAVLTAIAKKLEQRSALIKWKSVGKSFIAKESPPLELTPLFYKSGHMENDPISGDADFRAVNYYRPASGLRGMSQPPSPEAATNLIFKTRSFFGCNSRAEIMAWLLTHDSGHPAQIARDTHYFNKSIQGTLNEMEASGLVHSARKTREKHFRLTRENWDFFYGNDHSANNPPRWISWPNIFATIQLFYQTLCKPEMENASELFQASQLKKAFESNPFSFEYLTTEHATGKNYTHTVCNNIQSLLVAILPN